VDDKSSFGLAQFISRRLPNGVRSLVFVNHAVTFPSLQRSLRDIQFFACGSNTRASLYRFFNQLNSYPTI
jgi:hypothetical protein